MYEKIRKYIGFGFLVLFAIAVLATPSGGKMLTVLGMMVLAFFLLGLERLVRMILGIDIKKKHTET